MNLFRIRKSESFDLTVGGAKIRRALLFGLQSWRIVPEDFTSVSANKDKAYTAVVLV